MNRVYLFGKVVFKSKLKYIISPKLKLYMEIVIETISGDKFNCIVNEKIIPKLKSSDELELVYIIGNGTFDKKQFNVIVNNIYIY